MNCDEGSKSIPLYFYGELEPSEEERVEEHLEGCESCRGELERHRTLSAALDRRQLETPEALLEDCRDGLAGSIRLAGMPLAPVEVQPPARPSAAAGFAGFWTALWGFRQPIAAVALLPIGFFSARLVQTQPKTNLADATPAEPMIARVRSVQPDASGRVQIALDEVRQRVVSGRLDEAIASSNCCWPPPATKAMPGVRVESVGILKDHAGSAEIRTALLNVRGPRYQSRRPAEGAGRTEELRRRRPGAQDADPASADGR